MTLHLPKINIEIILSRILPIYIFFIFITTVVISYKVYLIHASYLYGDWLINYQGGFVRRGLIGEILYNIALILCINPGVLVFCLQTILYSILFYYTYKLLKAQDKLVPYIFLIFSPFIFNIQIFDFGACCRKEIIFLAFLAYLTYVGKVNDNFNLKFFTILLLCPIAILSHEMLFFFMPYLYIVYFYVNRKRYLNPTVLILCSIPSIIAFCTVILSNIANKETIDDIFYSLDLVSYHMEFGAISFLDKNMLYGFSLVQNVFISDKYYLYFIILILSIIAFLPVKSKIIQIVNNKVYLTLILSSITMSILLFLAAIDWGRWIYIHLFSIFIITLLFDYQDTGLSQKNNKILVFILQNPIYLFIAVILYFSSWHIPHCNPKHYIQMYIEKLPIFNYFKTFNDSTLF